MSSGSYADDRWLERVIEDVEKEIKKWSPEMQNALPSNRRMTSPSSPKSTDDKLEVKVARSESFDA